MVDASVYNGLAPGTFEAAAPPDIVFDRAEYQRRLRRVRELMAAAKVDVLYVTSPDHVCWLHGYFVSWYKANSPMRYPQLYGTAIHVDHDEFVHFDNPTEYPMLARTSVSTDNRYFRSRDADANLAFIVAELQAKGWLKGTIGLEMWSYVPNRAIGTMLEGAFLAGGARVVDASAIVRRARLVKSAPEIAMIEQATRICEIGHDTVRRNLRAGITELDLFGEVTAAMMKAGGEFPALIPIFNAVPVRDGKPISSGHSMAGRKVIEAGEFLTADLSGVYNRYHSNVMRGYYLGEPTRQMVEQHRKAAGLFDVFAREVKAGMTVREVNAIINRYVAEAGLADQPGWVLGYELGLSLPPDWVGEFYFHYKDERYLDRIFEENMVTNLESLFNTWLIDTLVYGKDGARVLSTVPLEVIAV